MEGEIRRVRRIGTSLKVTIPRDYAHDLRIEDGDYVLIRKDGDKLVIEKIGGE